MMEGWRSWGHNTDGKWQQQRERPVVKKGKQAHVCCVPLDRWGTAHIDGEKAVLSHPLEDAHTVHDSKSSQAANPYTILQPFTASLSPLSSGNPVFVVSAFAPTPWQCKVLHSNSGTANQVFSGDFLWGNRDSLGSLCNFNPRET